MCAYIYIYIYLILFFFFEVWCEIIVDIWMVSSKNAISLHPHLEDLFIILVNNIAQLAGAVEYTDSPNECPGYDTKQSDGELPVMLVLWEMQSNPLLPLLPGPL